MNSTNPTPIEAPAGTLPSPATPATPVRSSRSLKLVVGLLAAAAAAALFWPRGDGSTAAPGGFLLDSGGRPAPMAQRMSPVTLVHFWATWCPPCLQEIPRLQQLAAHYSGQHDFAVVMIAVADSADKVGSFLGPGGADMVLYDPNWDVAHRYGTRQLPETYLVARGRVVEKFVGETDWSDPAIRQRISELLATPPGEEKAELAPFGR